MGFKTENPVNVDISVTLPAEVQPFKIQLEYKDGKLTSYKNIGCAGGSGGAPSGVNSEVLKPDSEEPWTPLSEGLPDIGRPFKMRRTTNSSMDYFENCRLVKKLESGDYVWEITDVGNVALNVNNAWASNYQWRYLEEPEPETEEPWTPLSEELPDSDTYIELKCRTELGGVNYQHCQLKTWRRKGNFEWCIEGSNLVSIVGCHGVLSNYQWRYQEEK